MQQTTRRVGLRYPILIRQIRVEAAHEVFFGYATNISSTGIYIQTINPKQPGLSVRLRFNLPGNKQTLECAAEVVWSKEYDSKTSRKPGMGLKFLDISREDAALIDVFVRERQQAQISTPPPSPRI
ncbi:MAG TPA: TIGR02266 family protein [Acidobacteriota bacterium]